MRRGNPDPRSLAQIICVNTILSLRAPKSRGNPDLQRPTLIARS